jgi:uncharacterized protein YkwD
MSTRRRTPARTVAAVIGAAVLTGGLAVAAPSASAAPKDCNYLGYGSGPDQLGLKLDSVERALANNINAYRVSKGLRALADSTVLNRAAMWASIDDAHRGFAPSDHIDSRGMGAAQRVQYCTGYTGTLGEINYWGTGGANSSYGSGEAALKFWQGHQPHNVLLLSTAFTHFTVQRAYLGVNAETQFWTVEFGTR